jgi:DNA polymerase-3 subunit alpha
LDARLAEWLSESYGTIVYQDQVLLIAVNLAGFTWGKVNKFRKALSKKHMDEVEGYKGDFIEGCIRNGVKPDVAAKLFELILPFGGYGFNKAHAASYAVIAFYSAYLKANYPAEFMAATLTTEAQGADASKKVMLAVAECKRLGVPVLGPCVNKSDADFTVVDGCVRFGLRAIRGVGSKLVEEILRERSAGGCFTSLGNLCERIERDLTKGALEIMVKIGALDDLGERHRLLVSVEEAMQWGKRERMAKERGILSLFDEAEDALTFSLKKNVELLTHSQVLNWEKELLLSYISGHPLDEFSVALAAKCSHTTAMVAEEDHRRKVTLGGMIVDLRSFSTKNGTMQIAKLEDLYGSIDILVYSDMLEGSRSAWEEGAVVLVRGEVKADQEGRETSVVCRQVEDLRRVIGTEIYNILFTVRLSGSDPRSVSNDIIKVGKLGALLQKHPGRDRFNIVVDDVVVKLEDGQQCKVSVTFDIQQNTVAYTNTLHRQVVNLLGEASVAVQVVSQNATSSFPQQSHGKVIPFPVKVSA